MESKFKKGMVIKLNKYNDEEYLIVEDVYYDNEQYLVLNPFNEKESVQKISLEKMLLIKVKDDLDFDYIKDIELVKKIVDKIYDTAD